MNLVSHVILPHNSLSFVPTNYWRSDLIQLRRPRTNYLNFLNHFPTNSLFLALFFHIHDEFINMNSNCGNICIKICQLHSDVGDCCSSWIDCHHWGKEFEGQGPWVYSINYLFICFIYNLAVHFFCYCIYDAVKHHVSTFTCLVGRV